MWSGAAAAACPFPPLWPRDCCSRRVDSLVAYIAVSLTVVQLPHSALLHWFMFYANLFKLVSVYTYLSIITIIETVLVSKLHKGLTTSFFSSKSSLLGMGRGELGRICLMIGQPSPMGDNFWVTHLTKMGDLFLVMLWISLLTLFLITKKYIFYSACTMFRGIISWSRISAVQYQLLNYEERSLLKYMKLRFLSFCARSLCPLHGK